MTKVLSADGLDGVKPQSMSTKRLARAKTHDDNTPGTPIRQVAFESQSDEILMSHSYFARMWGRHLPEFIKGLALFSRYGT